jgi:hypothetical protein
MQDAANRGTSFCEQQPLQVLIVSTMFSNLGMSPLVALSSRQFPDSNHRVSLKDKDDDPFAKLHHQGWMDDRATPFGLNVLVVVFLSLQPRKVIISLDSAFYLLPLVLHSLSSYLTHFYTYTLFTCSFSPVIFCMFYFINHMCSVSCLPTCVYKGKTFYCTTLISILRFLS